MVSCNLLRLINDLRVKAPLDMNDHNMIEFYIQFERKKSGSKTCILNLIKGNYVDMKAELAVVNWDTRLEGRSTAKQWQTFKGDISEYSDYVYSY